MLIAVAAVAGVGAVMFLGALWTGRRSTSAVARVQRRRVGAVGLFLVIAAGAAYAVLSVPVESGRGTAAGSRSIEADVSSPGEDVATSRRFSSARMPALALDAPDGWTLALDEKARRLTASDKSARLSISTAILTDVVDVTAMLRQLADTQRTLGFEVGDLFTDRIGDLPAAGFLSTGPARSVCTWMVRRDTHLATSLICTADGKATARDVCRPVLARIQWRAPEQRAR